MNLKMIFACSLLLSTTGCVAAIPLIAQVASAGTSASQLCGLAKVPGQSVSLCDQFSLGLTTQPAGKPVNATTNNVATR